jgi:hypothetical protein
MARIRPNAANLQSRFNILDMLAVVFIPALMASLWPVQKPEERLVVFFPALGLAVASAWWTTTLIHTFKIKGTWKRLGLHLYAFLAFVAFLIFIPTSVSALFVAFADPSDRYFAYVLLAAVGCAIPTASILYLENIRQKVEKRFIDEAHGAAPFDAAATAAQNNLKQLLQTKKQDQ